MNSIETRIDGETVTHIKAALALNNGTIVNVVKLNADGKVQTSIDIYARCTKFGAEISPQINWTAISSQDAETTRWYAAMLTTAANVAELANEYM